MSGFEYLGLYVMSFSKNYIRTKKISEYRLLNGNIVQSEFLKLTL